LESLEDRSLLSTFTVIDLGDAGSGSGQEGDLRYAIDAANANPDPTNRIVFEPGLAGAVTLTRGKLEIAKSLEVVGPGADVLAVSGNDASGVFDVTAGADQAVALWGLTLRGGTGGGLDAQGEPAGGGLYNRDAAVTLDRCAVSDNAALTGGGIYNGHGTLALSDCAVADNHAVTARPGDMVCAIENGGVMSLTDCRVTDNTQIGQGLNVYNIENTGAMTFDRCALEGNTGSILNRNLISLTGCTIADNFTFGGAIDNFFLGGGVATATLADCTIANNTTLDASSGAMVGGGVTNLSGQMTLTGCTLTGNYSTNVGGGIVARSGHLEIENCTISGNTSRSGGAFITRAACWKSPAVRSRSTAPPPPLLRGAACTPAGRAPYCGTPSWPGTKPGPASPPMSGVR
jgi:hypothetical protein